MWINKNKKTVRTLPKTISIAAVLALPVFLFMLFPHSASASIDGLTEDSCFIGITGVAPTSKTISGHLYSAEGSGPVSGKTVILTVATSTPGRFASTTDANGNWSVSDILGLNAGRQIAVYVDNGSGFYAYVTTKATSTPAGFNDLDLYQNRIIIRHEGLSSATSTTLADLAFCDADSGCDTGSGDSDIQFTSNSGALTVKKGQELHIWPNKKFAPEANSTITLHGNAATAPDGDLHIANLATLDASASTVAINVAGNWVASSTSVFSPGTNTVTFTATTTGKNISATSSPFYNVTFSGAGGGWTFAANASTTNNLTIGPGLNKVDFSNRLLTIGGNYIASSTIATTTSTYFYFDSASSQTLNGFMTASTTLPNVIFQGTGAKTFNVNASTTNLTINPASGKVDFSNRLLTIGGNYIASSTIATTTSTYFYFDSSSAQTLAGFMTASTTLPNVIFQGTGTKTFQANASTTNLAINSGSGKVDFSNRLLTIGGNYIASSTIATTTSTYFYFDSASSQTLNGFMTASTTLPNVIFQGTGTKTFNANASTTNLTINPASGKVDFSNRLLTIGGNYIASSTIATTTSTYFYFNSSSAQTLNGFMTASTTLPNVIFQGAGTKTFRANASTTNFTIDSGGSVTISNRLVTIEGTYSNSGTLTSNTGTIYFTGTGKTHSGAMAGNSALGNVFILGGGTTALSNNASTTNLTINSGSSVTAPSLLSIAGDYSNSGTFGANSGTVYLSGTTMQTFSGNMTGTANAFYNLTVLNAGSGSPDVKFNNSASTTNNFTINTPSAEVSFLASATSTFTNLIWDGGGTGTRIQASSTVSGTKWGLIIPSGGSYDIHNTAFKDTYACDSFGGSITVYTSEGNSDVSGNSCINFEAAPPVGLAISGHLYSDEGVTAVDGKTVVLTVATSTPGRFQSITSGGGAWSVSVLNSGTNGLAAGKDIAVYVDGGSGVYAYVVTKATSTPASFDDLDLYQNRIIVRHEGLASATSTTLADLAFCDADSGCGGGTGDTDIQFTSNSGTLTVKKGQELHIWPNKKFAPEGQVTLHGNAASAPDGDLHIANLATLDASASGANITLAGNFVASSTSVFTPGSNTVTWNASTTRQMTSNGKQFYNLTIDGFATTSDRGDAGGGSFGVTNTLTVNADKFLEISDDATGDDNYASSSASGAASGSVVINGTIMGAGTLGVANSYLGTGGTLSSRVRFDATNGNITMPARTYGGTVEPYNSGSTNRQVTMGSGTFYFQSALQPMANGTGNLTLSGANNNPTVTVSGNLDYSGTDASGQETIWTGTGLWTIAGNVDLKDTTSQAGVFTASTTPDALGINLTGSSKTILSGSQSFASTTFATGASYTLSDELTITGTTTIAGTINGQINALKLTGTNMPLYGGGTAGYLWFSNYSSYTLYNADLTVGKTILEVSFDQAATLTLDSGRYYVSTSSLSLQESAAFATITGSGTTTIKHSALSTTGTLNSNIRFDATDGNITIPARTYGGSNVEIYASSTSERTVAMDSGSQTISGNLLTNMASTTNVILDADDQDPTVTVTGNVDFLTQGLSNGLVGHWSFNKSDLVQNVADISGSGNHGKLMFGTSGAVATSTMASSTGKIDQALGFDGTDDYVAVSDPGSSSLDITGTAITISAWIYPRTLTPTEAKCFVCKGISGGGTTQNYQFYQVSGGEGEIEFDFYNGSWNTHSSVNNVLSINTWQFITVRYDGSNVYLYVNGAKVDQSTSESENTAMLANNQNLWIGSDNSSDAYFNGLIDEVRVYNRALDSGEIQALYLMKAPQLKMGSNSWNVDGNLDVSYSTTTATSNNLNLAGNYTNSGGYFVTNSAGTVILDGTNQQTLSGNMVGDKNAFNNLTVTNNFGDGDATNTPSVIFNNSASTTATFAANTGTTTMCFASGPMSSNSFTFQNINWTGLANTGVIKVRSANYCSIAGGIDSTNKYAWCENPGWFNFGTSGGNVKMNDTALYGYIWGENIGWISLNCTNTSSCGTIDYKVSNSGGYLSGYAWGENVGWINFNPTGGGVTIDANGDFHGYAWGENIGWVVFNCDTTSSCGTVSYKVNTTWRP